MNNTLNNKYSNFPAVMDDGRYCASWTAAPKMNADLDRGFSSNWQYRQYLTDNANYIINKNKQEACEECCGTTDVLSRISNMFEFKKTNEVSDLKKEYLSRAQLQSRLVTPVLTQEELLRRGFLNWN